MTQPRLFAFAASAREGSYNQQLLRAALSHIGEEASVDMENDYTQLTLPNYEDQDAIPEAAHAITQRFAEADALMIAAPEYNWSMPGSLKNTIDWVSRVNIRAFADKPVLLLCASPSVRGGAVGLTQLRVPLEVLGAWVYPQLITIGTAHDAFAEEGHLLLEKDAAFLQAAVTDFVAKANKFA